MNKHKKPALITYYGRTKFSNRVKVIASTESSNASNKVANNKDKQSSKFSSDIISQTSASISDTTSIILSMF